MSSTSDFPSAHSVGLHNLNFSLSNQVLETSSVNDDSTTDKEQSDTTSGLYLEQSSFPLSDLEEATLLRYYVQRLAQDFDLSDPQRHFRTVVPQRAATCPLLLNAIYALSAKHLSRVSNYDPLISDKYHQECLRRVIPALSDSAAILDENLLACTIILRHLEEFEVPLSGYSPSDRQSHLLGSHAFIRAQEHSPMSDGLRKAAFWVGLRQEIYVAFVNQRSIAIELNNFNLDRSCDPAPDYVWACRAVALCADAIRFFYGKDDRLNSEYDQLSEAVNEWHSCKSSNFTAMYFRDADEGELFPNIWFTSDEHVLGWQHYYIAKLLLAAHNPRIPKLGPSRAISLRAIDEEIKGYVKLLCGIAMSNQETAPNFTFVLCSSLLHLR